MGFFQGVESLFAGFFYSDDVAVSRREASRGMCLKHSVTFLQRFTCILANMWRRLVWNAPEGNGDGNGREPAFCEPLWPFWATKLGWHPRKGEQRAGEGGERTTIFDAPLRHRS